MNPREQFENITGEKAIVKPGGQCSRYNEKYIEFLEELSCNSIVLKPCPECKVPEFILDNDDIHCWNCGKKLYKWACNNE